MNLIIQFTAEYEAEKMFKKILEQNGITDYEYGYMAVTLICGLIAALIAGWMTVAKLLEKRAFKKASELSNKIFLSETHKLNVEWQNWKMQNSDD